MSPTAIAVAIVFYAVCKHSRLSAIFVSSFAFVLSLQINSPYTESTRLSSFMFHMHVGDKAQDLDRHLWYADRFGCSK